MHHLCFIEFHFVLFSSKIWHFAYELKFSKKCDFLKSGRSWEELKYNNVLIVKIRRTPSCKNDYTVSFGAIVKLINNYGFNFMSASSKYIFKIDIQIAYYL